MSADAKQVIDLRREKLRRAPVMYQVTFRHGADGMSFIVTDVLDTAEDRLAVARDFEAAAASLRGDCGVGASLEASQKYVNDGLSADDLWTLYEPSEGGPP